MNWNILQQIDDLDQVREKSFHNPQLIFKHSTRCSISAMAKGRLDRMEEENRFEAHYLDLIRYRDLSNRIAEIYHVQHESPQILLIRNGECVLDASHMDIDPQEILEQAGH